MFKILKLLFNVPKYRFKFFSNTRDKYFLILSTVIYCNFLSNQKLFFFLMKRKRFFLWFIKQKKQINYKYFHENACYKVDTESIKLMIHLRKNKKKKMKFIIRNTVVTLYIYFETANYLLLI